MSESRNTDGCHTLRQHSAGEPAGLPAGRGAARADERKSAPQIDREPLLVGYVLHCNIPYIRIWQMTICWNVFIKRKEPLLRQDECCARLPLKDDVVGI
eukprot:6207898-Pleurochrysis_carterae.AAC.2